MGYIVDNFSPKFKLITQNKLYEDLTVYGYEMDNKLTVVFIEDKRSIGCMFSMWVGSGARNEKPGTTGIAHLFEHMMFRPLKKGDVGYDELGKGKLIIYNAGTSTDYTYFWEKFFPEHLDDVLKMESDRFKNLVVDDEKLNIEREIVRSEYIMTVKSKPYMDLFHTVYKVAYKGTDNPYRWAILGYYDDLSKIKASDCNKFFSKYYKPNNCLLVIGGNVDRKKTLSKIYKYFKDWKPSHIKPLNIKVKLGKKQIISHSKVKSSKQLMLFSYRIPPSDLENIDKINMLSEILAGQAGILKKELVDKLRVASDVSIFTTEGIFSILVEPIIKDQKEIIKQFDNCLEKFYEVSTKDYKKYVEAYVLDKKENSEKLYDLSESIGNGWTNTKSYQYALDFNFNLDKSEIINFAKKYFKQTNRVIIKSKT